MALGPRYLGIGQDGVDIVVGGHCRESARAAQHGAEQSRVRVEWARRTRQQRAQDATREGGAVVDGMSRV